MTNKEYSPSLRFVKATAAAIEADWIDVGRIYHKLKTLPFMILGTMAHRGSFDGRAYLPVIDRHNSLTTDIAELVLLETGLQNAGDRAVDFLRAFATELHRAAQENSVSAKWGRLTMLNGEMIIEISDGCGRDEGIQAPPGWTPAVHSRSTRR